MAILYKTDGSTQWVEPKNGITFSLNELQKFVDGYIQIISLNHTSVLVLNEDGKGQYPENITATKIAKMANAIFFDDYLVGDVLVCNNNEIA